MPFEIILDELPIGYPLSTAEEGEKVAVAVKEFTSSEDGDFFIGRLDGIPNKILSRLPKKAAITPSRIDHLLAIIRKDKTATVYINELHIVAESQVKRPITTIEKPITMDDLADIEKVLFPDIEIPNDSGFIFLFSVGWRKGLFFDFFPIFSESPQNRTDDLPTLLGQFYAYLLFQNVFKVTDDEWTRLSQQDWFPFIILDGSTVKQILNYNRLSKDIDVLLPEIKGELLEKLPNLSHSWSANPFIADHMPFIQTAIERYANNDHISAISILYPRIEGVMRNFLLVKDKQKKASQKNLVTHALSSKDSSIQPYSWLLPKRFESYLHNIFFANFDPEGEKPLSRHTVSHGVAEAESFSLKGATLGFLTLAQLSFYLKPIKHP